VIGRAAWCLVVLASMASMAATGCRGSQPDAPAAPSATPHATPSAHAAAAGERMRANGVVLITIDTLRADRVGAYGWRAARTPSIDALAARGVRADRAFAAAPITLTSHASLLTGLYPPGHGARHNGMRLRADVPTLAGTLQARGFATGAFVAAFPLDRRFGLDRGFDVYSDRLPRGADGRLLNERPGRVVVDEALAWLGTMSPERPFLLWVHLFEPHAPYEADPAFGSSPATRSVSDRYDDEVARADAQVARLVGALAPRAASTLFIVAGDHGEAFGEHGELGHSVFVYDTTLRVPLVLAGAGVNVGAAADVAGFARAGSATAGARGSATAPASGRDKGQRRGDEGEGRSGSAAAAVIREPVSLVDVVPTVLELLGLPAIDGDGMSLAPALASALSDVREGSGAGGDGRSNGGGSGSSSGSGGSATSAGSGAGARTLYAESFAPLLDFGWSPLRSLRVGNEKYIAAPKAELYDVALDSAETRNLLNERSAVARELSARVDRIAPNELPPPASESGSKGGASASADREAEVRLRSLGYLASSGRAAAAPAASVPAGAGPDPKDRVELVSRIAEVTSGELRGAALRAALERLVHDDARNGQMQMRLGFVLQESGACPTAVPHFEAAIAAGVPSADPGLGLAECLGAMGRGDAARRALVAAERVEPGNPIVSANLGMMDLDAGQLPGAIDRLRKALAIAPDLHQARFALARAYGRAGQRADAAREARELLTRLPPDAPQRPEVERLLAAVQ
jgi:tetratricopeptide (TPR) repeat protein